MNVYPGIFVVAGLMQSSRYVNDIVSSWSQAIRDKEFLVEMRLRNHDPNEDELVEVLARPA
jgi:E3 ubiquitin-protein ligase MARCH6